MRRFRSSAGMSGVVELITRPSARSNCDLRSAVDRAANAIPGIKQKLAIKLICFHRKFEATDTPFTPPRDPLMETS